MNSALKNLLLFHSHLLNNEIYDFINDTIFYVTTQGIFIAHSQLNGFGRNEWMKFFFYSIMRKKYEEDLSHMRLS